MEPLASTQPSKAIRAFPQKAQSATPMPGMRYGSEDGEGMNRYQ
jgi:hypothetical protein